MLLPRKASGRRMLNGRDSLGQLRLAISALFFFTV